jgi:hypothetical protein
VHENGLSAQGVRAIAQQCYRGIELNCTIFLQNAVKVRKIKGYTYNKKIYAKK